MKRNDFREQAQDLISEYGAQCELDGDNIIWWFEADKKTTTKLPPHGGDYRGLRNSAAKWKRELEAARPAHFVLQSQTNAEKDKWTAYLDKCLHDIRTEFEAKFEAIKGEVTASTDIALDAGLKVGSFAKAFSGVFGQVNSQPAPIATQSIPQTPITQSLPAPKAIPQPVEKAKKGLDDLDHVRKQKWAEVVAEIDDEFELSDLDGRILYFLYKCGPQTPHDLKVAGVWRSIDSATRFLENMEAEGLVRFLVAEKKWAITNDGIASLEEDEMEPEAPEPIASKPTLTVVPSGPRILRPVEPARDVASMKLTYPEKAMVVLLNGEMTIEELQKAIGHKSGVKSLANMLYSCERDSGYIEYVYSQGKIYRITEKGRAYIQRITPEYKDAS